MSARHASRPLFPGGSDVAGDGQTILVDGTPDIIWSIPLSLTLGDMVSFHLEWNGTDSTGTTIGTGNLTATVDVYASNKDDLSQVADDTADPADWVQLSSISFSEEPAGTASKTILTLGNMGYRYVALKVDRTSGDGNIRGWAMAKGE